ncbi:MAG: choice-of-anchor D domain-containing protein [Geobacter sp.]|nr:MAG: choice-of-anchor D domain-containing protein [Geobacter sp.]
MKWVSRGNWQSSAKNIFKLFMILLIILAASLPAFAAVDPVLVTSGLVNSYNTKPIVRTSSGSTYYFIGNAGHTGQWDGWVEAYMSANGSSWNRVAAEDQWRGSKEISVAMDSQNVAHMITLDWNYHPYYKKFNTTDSPKGDHSWEGYELLESQMASSDILPTCAIAIDSNGVPHVVYALSESSKGKTYITVTYANRIGGIWHKTVVWPIANGSFSMATSQKLDIAIGPDNVPYILMGPKILKGNSNNPTAFDTKDLGTDNYSFVIHQNGDVRVALSSNGFYANYLHSSSQPWLNGWDLQVSSTTGPKGVLTLVKDVPYEVKVLDAGIGVQRYFEPPILVSPKYSSGTIWEYPATRWSFYNNGSPGVIDLGVQQYINGVTKYFLYSKYNAATTADFRGNATSGFSPVSVNFSDNSIAADGKSIASWAWDFNNDGIIDSTEQNPSFTFTNVGKYTVSLTVTDSSGLKDTQIKKDYVEVKAGVDSDGDGIADSVDNCPTVYNPKQTDLDGNGIGDACEGPIDLFHQALFVTGLRTETTNDKAGQDITTLMKDGLFLQGVRVQAASTFDVATFKSNVEANKLGRFVLNLFVSNLYGGTPQTVRIYPYSADGVTVQNVAMSGTIYSGWNNIDLTSILSTMNNMGFVKFRVVAPQNWFDISEAFLTELADPQEISTTPPALSFGSVEFGKTSILPLTIASGGSGTLSIDKIIQPSLPFSVVTDDCSGKKLSASGSCSVTANFAPSALGPFSGALTILSNDADHPSISVRLSGSGIQPTNTLTGIITDSSTGLRISGAAVAITDMLGNHSAVTDANGTYVVSGVALGSFTGTIQKAGYITQGTNGSISSSTQTLNIQLVPLPSLTLTITSPQDAAVVTSSQISVTGNVSNNASVTVNGVAATVINGSYTAAVPASEGPNTITANASDQYSQNTSRQVTVTLITKGTLVGKITNVATGQPVPSATITVTDSVNAVHTTTTDSTGTYSIPDLKAGAFAGNISAAGYANRNISGTILPAQSVTADWTLTSLAATISAISAPPLTADSTVITWTTNQPATSLVEYGETTSYGNSVSDAAFTTTHSIAISGLKPSTTYHFRVSSTNTEGYTSTAADTTFSTPAFTAKTIGDTGNVTVMEVTGNYDAKNPDGSSNDVPRQEIAKEFFRAHPDTFDTLAIFSNFDYALVEGDTRGFYTSIKNDVQGIGRPLYDSSAAFGSSGKLHGTIDMGNIAAAGAPGSTQFDQAITTLTHEQMHRFGAYVIFKKPDGSISTALLGKDAAHWSYLLDSQGSVMYGNAWKDNKDGTFTSTSIRSSYSPLDLYLMGMIDKTQVPPMTLIENPAVDPKQYPNLGATVSGTTRTVTIDDIIAAEGERIPNAAQSQKTFKTAFILVTKPGTFTGSEPAVMESIRNAYAGRFAELTGSKGSIADVAPSLTVTLASPADGSTVTGPDVTVSGTIINTTGAETGVVVNGLPATVTGNRYIVNHVPLQTGANTIFITATDVNGLTATTARSVTAAAGYYLRILPNVESGTAPLNISLQLNGSFVISNPTVTVSGPAPLTLTAVSATEYAGIIPFEGGYTITASAIGPDGQTYSDSVTLTVLSRFQMDNLLRTKWDGINSKMIQNDIDGALQYLRTSSRDYYQELFTALGNQLAVLAQSAPPLEFVYASEDRAKCRVFKQMTVQGQSVTVGFPIYFEKEDGIWRLIKY